MSYSEDDLYSVFGIENNPKIYCYMIATLQMLFTIKEFREYILDYEFFLDQVQTAYGRSYNERILKKYCFYELYNLLKNGDDQRSRSLFASAKNIDGLKQIIRKRIADGMFNIGDKKFNIDEQNDAAEFLFFFLNILHSEIYRIEKAITLEEKVSDISNERSYISYVFKINYDFQINDNGTSYILSKGMRGYNDVKKEIIMNDYVISIKLNDSRVQSLPKKSLTLQNLLNFSFGIEAITKEYDYYTIVKKFHDFPTYVMLCIDRFKLNGDKSLMDIDISKTINILGRSYNIISVVCHNGRSARSGHYITFAERDGYWYLFDDEDFRPTCSDDVLRLISGRDNRLIESKEPHDFNPYLILCKKTENFKHGL